MPRPARPAILSAQLRLEPQEHLMRKQLVIIELVGSRGDTMFYADILANGFVHGRNVDASDIDIPPAHVLVDVAAIEDDPGVQPGQLCANS
jgi:hypothetical protein